MKQISKTTINVVFAFAIVYIAWGSTYFFIQKALEGFPPFILGALRFMVAAGLMFLWCIYKNENLFIIKQIKQAFIGGFLLLFVGNGAVIWVEQSLPSGLVAIMVSSSPLWFIVFDKPKWKENFSNRSTVTGLVIGFIGVLLLFYRNLIEGFTTTGRVESFGLIIVTIAAISWSAGSLYSKYRSENASAIVNSAWQMFAAAIAFTIAALIHGEMSIFQFSAVSAEAWWSMAYLIVFGSIAGFSAYLWLLDARPITQVSTYAYVNPVVAVLIGVIFAAEKITTLQIIGLAIILLSVMLVNLAKYRKKRN